MVERDTLYYIVSGFHNTSNTQTQFCLLATDLKATGKLHLPVNRLPFKDFIHTPLLSHFFSLLLLVMNQLETVNIVHINKTSF